MRKVAKLASSLSSPVLFIGIASIILAPLPPGANLSQAPFVGKGPGAIPFNLIPLLPHSAANDLVIVARPDLDIADGTV